MHSIDSAVHRRRRSARAFGVSAESGPIALILRWYTRTSSRGSSTVSAMLSIRFAGPVQGRIVVERAV